MQLAKSAKQRRVPSSQIARVISFGSLFAGLGVGTAAEFVRRGVGLSNTPKEEESLESMFLTPANTQRIVDTLCKVRGTCVYKYT